jgi:hypothetical protein
VAAVALAAEQLGGAQRALDMAVSTPRSGGSSTGPSAASRRSSTAAPTCCSKVESLRSAVGYAAAAVAEDSAEIPVLASLVKAYASETYFPRGRGEHPDPRRHRLHLGARRPLYFKRAKASELFLGDGAYHRERLANRIGL